MRPASPTAALVVALAGAMLILALQALPAAGTALEYRRALLATEPWRLLGAHLVHINWPHALVNAAAWLVLARLFDSQLGARAQLVCLGSAALVVSLALAAMAPQIAWYRGASAVLHALYFAGATALLIDTVRGGEAPRRFVAIALVAIGWTKLAFEHLQGADMPIAAWLGAPVVQQAHLFGAVWGTAFGLAVALRRGVQR